MKEDPAQKAQRELVDAARKLLLPTPVRLHHVPNWLRLAMLKAFGCNQYATNGADVLFHAMTCLSPRDSTAWLDHWGSTNYRDKNVFVSEPYSIGENSVQQIAQFAKKCGCNWYISPNSWWYPGQTLRIVFYQEKP